MNQLEGMLENHAIGSRLRMLLNTITPGYDPALIAIQNYRVFLRRSTANGLSSTETRDAPRHSQQKKNVSLIL